MKTPHPGCTDAVANIAEAQFWVLPQETQCAGSPATPSSNVSGVFPDSSSHSFHFKPGGGRVWLTEPRTFVFTIAARESGTDSV